MKLSEYMIAVDRYVFEEYIDIPLLDELMVKIVALEFEHNNLPLKNACLFAQLIIDLSKKQEFDFDLEYEPFNVFDVDELNVDEYKFIPSSNFESFLIILDGERKIEIQQQDKLSYKDVLRIVKKQDEPLI